MTIKREFFKFVIPSIISMLAMSLDTIVDGIFIGKGIGPNALAAVNLTAPVINVIYAIAIFIGIGGMTLTSIKLGEDKIDQANQIFNQSIFTVVSGTTIF